MILAICPRCFDRREMEATQGALLADGGIKCGECLMAATEIVAFVPVHSAKGIAARYRACELGFDTASVLLRRDYGMSFAEVDDLLIPRRKA